MATPRPILLDCDPGHDDALAIMLAVASPLIDLRAVTTVAGNTTLPNTTANALRVLDLLQANDVPLASGASAPLSRPLETAQAMHGETGLAGPDPFAPLIEQSRAKPTHGDALALVREVCKETPEPITLVATGPLTNVANFLTADPSLAGRLREIVLMGGAIGLGNWTPAAEFNIWVDPEAAKIVFRAGVPLTMIGLEVTHQAIIEPDDVERWRGFGGVGEFAAQLMDHFVGYHQDTFGWPGAPLHDAVTIAHLIEPGLVKTLPMAVDVETESELCRGRTVVDQMGVTGVTPNAQVGVGVNRNRFVTLMTEHLAFLS